MSFREFQNSLFLEFEIRKRKPLKLKGFEGSQEDALFDVITMPPSFSRRVLVRSATAAAAVLLALSGFIVAVLPAVRILSPKKNT